MPYERLGFQRADEEGNAELNFSITSSQVYSSVTIFINIRILICIHMKKPDKQRSKRRFQQRSVDLRVNITDNHRPTEIVLPGDISIDVSNMAYLFILLEKDEAKKSKSNTTQYIQRIFVCCICTDEGRGVGCRIR